MSLQNAFYNIVIHATAHQQIHFESVLEKLGLVSFAASTGTPQSQLGIPSTFKPCTVLESHMAD